MYTKRYMEPQQLLKTAFLFNLKTMFFGDIDKERVTTFYKPFRGGLYIVS